MTAVTAASHGKPRRAGVTRRRAAGPLFVTPFLLLFVLLFVGPLAYAAYLRVVPLMVAFLLLQRYWRSGLTAGGVKQ